MDSKFYKVNGIPLQIAIINSANVSEIMERKIQLLEEIGKYIKDNNKELFVLNIIEIINLDSTILVKGNLSKRLMLNLKIMKLFLKE